MRQIEITGGNNTRNFRLVKTEVPTPDKGEVVIQVKAAGVNFADILIRKGLHPDSPEPPLVPGFEVSGLVTAIGAGVEPGWIGGEVMAIMPRGGYADYVSVPVDLVFRKPAELTHEQAATVPVVYLTAWQCLVIMGSLNAGETLLIHNMGGGFGLAALDIARHMDVTIIGTASRHKHEFLKSRGAHRLIDYTSGNWKDEVLEATQGKGAELIIDPIGGTHWKTSYECLRNTGRLSLFGISTALNHGKGRTLSLIKTAMQMPFYHPLGLMNGNKGVFGVSMQNLWQEREKSRQWMSCICEGIQSGRYKPHVDRSFSLEEAGKAHQYIENRENLGKVVLLS
ncbi:MAG: zinc-binding dehydrogenase [Ketobacteraceae bacterium]|nr:zinc-binding dehydrogenase [Ketobacteraceae bacterium]